MKKFFIIACIMIAGGFAFAQKSLGAANRNTAVRCLKLAENCLMGNDNNGALRQAELGLSYDNSISDLIYIKAAALSRKGELKANVITVIKEAFDKDNWVGYNKTGARLLYADLLSDTGDYDISMQTLDVEPFIYSADAEFIRIKNYYRIGTEDSIEQARLKINAARRIYPNDVRFPNIFFLFEELYLSINEIFNNDTAIETNPLVQTIAEAYIAKLPDYENKNQELELLAAFFAKGEEQLRLVKALDAKSKENHPLLAILGLKTGLYNPEQAFDYFIKACNGNISLITFEYFMKSVNTDEIFNKVAEYFVNYEGSIYVDVNYDLQNEMIVNYETGRPQYITLDSNNDGQNEIYCKCDFGVPKNLYLMNNEIEYIYDAYPAVSKVKWTSLNETVNYLYDDFIYYPFEMAKEPFLAIMGLDFYVPAAGSFTYPELNDLSKAASVELPGTERDNSRVVYTLHLGEPVSAKFYEGDIQYAYCDFQTGIPFTRYADYDNDGYFETSEMFDLYEIGQNFGGDDNTIVKNIFGIFPEDYRIYLRRVSIDRNSNTYAEYSEEYLENNGKISTWDNDDNGIPDYQYIKYPFKEGEPLKEETIFYSKNGVENLSLSLLDGLPYTMKSAGKEIMIFAGKTDKLYWIEENGNAEYEDALKPHLAKIIEQGSIEIFNITGIRISAIRIGDLFFCKLIPESFIEEE